MVHLPTGLVELLETYRALDRADLIEELIGAAGRFREVPEAVARRPFPEAARVPACESEAFVFSESLPDGSLKFYFAVENPQGLSAKAMAVMLDETLSGTSLTEVAGLTGEFVVDLFGRELSMGKNLGLQGMVGLVAKSARQALAKRENG
jgi:cysteine desulfuration protein SufE